MLESTLAVWERTIKDIKKLCSPFHLLMNTITIIAFCYNLIMKVGFFWINLPLILFTIFNYGFIIGNRNENTQKKAATIRGRIKIGIKFFEIIITLYNLCITSMNVTIISIILTALMIVAWLLSVVFEVISIIMEQRISVLIEAALHDFEIVVNLSNKAMKLNNQQVFPIPNDHEKEIQEMRDAYMAAHHIVVVPKKPKKFLFWKKQK